MTNDALQRLKAELDDWRARFDHLRVQANLGRKEARDKLADLEQRFTPAFNEAKRRVNEAVESGTTEAKTLGKSLLAGWDELRRTHRDLSHEAKVERDEARRDGRR